MQNRTLIYSFLESDYFITFYHFKTAILVHPFALNRFSQKKSANPETWSAHCLLAHNRLGIDRTKIGF